MCGSYLRISKDFLFHNYRKSHLAKGFGGTGFVYSFFGIFGSDGADYDVTFDDKKLSESYINRGDMTWKERLDLMFRTDEFENWSPELMECFEISLFTSTVGFFLGGYKRSRGVFDHFVAANKHEMFRHPKEAQLAVWDRVLLSMIKGGFSTGWRCLVISSLFSVGINTSNVVRNYVQPLDHALVGFGVGAFYRTLMGPRAMLASGVVGAGLGMTEGCLTWALLKISGETVEQRWNRKFQYIENTNDKLLEQLRIEQAKLVPRNQWVANESEESDQTEEETEWSPTVIAKYIITKLKDLLLPRILDD